MIDASSLGVWHASVVEIIWTALGVVGMWYGQKNLRDSSQDIAALREMNGHSLARYRVMRKVAYGHFRNDCFRFAKHLTIFFIGVVAMLLPPQNGANQVSATGIVVTGGLFCISVLIVLASALDHKQRVETLEEKYD